MPWPTGIAFVITHLNLSHAESTSGTDLGVVTHRGATHDRADGTAGGTREHLASLDHTVVGTADLARGLVEPCAHMPLPPLVEVGIRNHTISLHLGCGFLLQVENVRLGSTARRRGRVNILEHAYPVCYHSQGASLVYNAVFGYSRWSLYGWLAPN